MKSRVLATWFAVFVLLVCITPVLAQRPIERELGFPFSRMPEFPALPLMPPMPVMPEMPPMPPMPAMPLMPPMPEMPPMPPFPPMNGFAFGFPEQLKEAATANPEVVFQQDVFRSILRNSPDRALDLAAERLKADPADPVVLASLSAIASSTSPKAVPLLVSIAKTSTNLEARRSAASALARNRGDKDSLAILEDLYNSSSDSVELRRSIVASISRMSDPRTIAVLTRIARTDPDLSIRRSAVQYLGNRSEPDTLKALEDLLKTPGKG